jgi:hypothetical protein
MQNLNKAKKIKIRVKNRRYKKLSMFQLQNQGSGQVWGNWVTRRV